MSNYPLNTWLDPVVQNYVHYFGSTPKPVVWEVGSRDGRDGVELAKRIYDGNLDWFWSNARVVCLEPNPMQAEIIRAESLNSITIVSESGFDSNNDNDWCFSTMELLEQSDQIKNYRL